MSERTFFQRRRGSMRKSDGGWNWSRWVSCTEAEAQRVTGLQSWQVRSVGVCPACAGTGHADAAPSAGQTLPAETSEKVK